MRPTNRACSYRHGSARPVRSRSPRSDRGGCHRGRRTRRSRRAQRRTCRACRLLGCTGIRHRFPPRTLRRRGRCNPRRKRTWRSEPTRECSRARRERRAWRAPSQGVRRSMCAVSRTRQAFRSATRVDAARPTGCPAPGAFGTWHHMRSEAAAQLLQVDGIRPEAIVAGHAHRHHASIVRRRGFAELIRHQLAPGFGGSVVHHQLLDDRLHVG